MTTGATSSRQSSSTRRWSGPRACRGSRPSRTSRSVYLFHLVDPASSERGARRPRGNETWPEVGIYAQRAKRRPNQIGIGVCELQRVEGLALTVRGLDAIEGTPVLDLKPYMTEMRRALGSTPAGLEPRADARLLVGDL